MHLSIVMQNEKGVYFSNSELVSVLQKVNSSKIIYNPIGDEDIKTTIEYLNPVISLKYNKIYGLKWSYHFCPYNDKIKIYISNDYSYAGTTDDKGRINTDNKCSHCEKFAGLNDEYNFCISRINWKNVKI